MRLISETQLQTKLNTHKINNLTPIQSPNFDVDPKINNLTPIQSPNFDVDPLNGAGDETRTRDVFLGKEVLYH